MYVNMYIYKNVITLSGHIGKVVASQAEVARLIPAAAETAPIYTVHEAFLGVLPMRVEGVTSQLDLPSLMPLSIAGWGQLQLGVPHRATSVDYCK